MADDRKDEKAPAQGRRTEEGAVESTEERPTPGGKVGPIEDQAQKTGEAPPDKG